MGKFGQFLKISEFWGFGPGNLGIEMKITCFTLTKTLLHAGLRPNLGFGIFWPGLYKIFCPTVRQTVLCFVKLQIFL